MSKFFSRTSCKFEKQTPQPMTFLYLDLMANSLLHETDKIWFDFGRKTDFIREQEQRILEAEKNLLAINDLRDMLNASVVKIEIELQEYECDVLKAEKTLSHLEQFVEDVPSWLTCGEMMRSDSALLLKLLASSEKSIAEINRLNEEISAFNEEADSQRPTWKLIFSIMEYHVQALEQTENQLSELQDKVDQTSLTYKEIKKEMCECGNGVSDIC